MSPEAFKAIRTQAALSHRRLAAILGLGPNGARHIRRIEDGEIKASGPVSVCMEMIERGVL